MGMIYLNIVFTGMVMGQTYRYELPSDVAQDLLDELVNGHHVLFDYDKKRIYINPDKVCMAYLECE